LDWNTIFISWCILQYICLNNSGVLLSPVSMGPCIVGIRLPKHQMTISKSHLLNQLRSISFKMLKWGHTQSQTEWWSHKLPFFLKPSAVFSVLGKRLALWPAHYFVCYWPMTTVIIWLSQHHTVSQAQTSFGAIRVEKSSLKRWDDGWCPGN
jgi:hypothetical protein